MGCCDSYILCANEESDVGSCRRKCPSTRISRWSFATPMPDIEIRENSFGRGLGYKEIVCAIKRINMAQFDLGSGRDELRMVQA